VFTEGQVIDLVRWWNAQNNGPIADDICIYHAEGGIHRGTPREPKHVSDLFDPLDVLSAVSFVSVRTPDVLDESKKYEPVKPFPIHCLPGVAGEYVAAAAESIGCTHGEVGLPLLASLARAIGNKRIIEPKRKWRQHASIWGVIIGKSGTAKTHAINVATQFLHDRQNELHAANEEKKKQYDCDMKEWKVRNKAWEDLSRKALLDSKLPAMPAEPEEPKYEHMLSGDTTIEAMALILRDQNGELLVETDELIGWLNGMGEYKKGKNGDVNRWLSIWSAKPITINRITKNIRIPQPCVSVIGGIQPGILKRAITQEHKESGLCARLLLVQPPHRTMRWNEATISHILEFEMARAFDDLMRMDAETKVLTLMPAAKALWVDYVNRHADEADSLEDDLRAAWIKLEAYTARFALIIQSEPDKCVKGGDEIDADTMKAAIQLSDWFGDEARRVYGFMNEADHPLADFVELVRRKGGRITPRELARSSRKFQPTAVAKATCELAVARGLGEWVNGCFNLAS
jgi:hypothetical protein